MRNLLVTGGAGFIGTNFVYYWLKNHPQDNVIVLDSLTYAGKKENLKNLSNKHFKLIIGDISHYELVLNILRAENIDTIVNFAAESHVDRSIIGPDIFLNTNILGTHQLLKAARQVWIEENKLKDSYRFHHISTDEVYGSLAENDPAFTETSIYAPNSPYAASKASSDHIVRAYFHTYGLPITTSNCSNNYGPYQFPEKLIPLLITNALLGKKLPIYGDGMNIRDWLYVVDHCRGIEAILLKGKVGEVYNIGGNNEQPNIKIAKLIAQLIEQTFYENKKLTEYFPQCPAAKGHCVSELIEFVKDRPGHDRRYAINAQKIQQQLNFTPQENFISGMKKTLHWYLENEWWWNNCHPERNEGSPSTAHKLVKEIPRCARDDT